MKALVFICLLAGTAAADPARFAPSSAVVKLVTDHVASLQIDPAIPTIIGPTGKRATADTSIGDMFGMHPGALGFEPGKIVAATDDAHGIGWFQGEFTAAIESTHTLPQGGYTQSVTSPQRLSGVVVGSGASWHIAAVMYGNVAADKDLASSPVPLPAAASVAFLGDPKIGKDIAPWFASGFAKHAVSDPNIVASGTGPGEFRTGPAAVKLAGGADRLGLVATEIEVTPIGTAGAAAFVRATLLLPIPKTRSAVPLAVAAVIVPAPDGWRWVSLEFGRAGDPQY